MSDSITSYKNQADYLASNGYFGEGVTSQKLLDGKKAWRRLYQREHKRNQRKKIKTVTVKMSVIDYDRLLGYAQDMNLSVARVLLESALAQKDAKRLIKPDHISELIQQLKMCNISLYNTLYMLEDENTDQLDSLRESQISIEALIRKMKAMFRIS